MLSFRPATSNDSAGMKELQEMSIQAGIIQTQIKLRVEDANTALKADRPGSQTFLAYLGEATTPVGTISGWPHLACYGDGNEPTQAVLVYRLAVHPEYRKRGIAKALWQELNNWIKTTYGEEVLTYGYFQKGNEASQAWFRIIGGIFTQREVTLAPIKTLLAGKVKSHII